ncbi:MAG: sigma-70 family RNA polymerase sigma factor [Clostridia bacterium]|nr:sigma-70 family RNA polymerase sigma factor [Clostridia bacterium]
MPEREITVSENLGLVHACAGRFRGRGIEYDDLYQAGCVGLIKAADNFNPDLGYKFSTYAVPVIIGEIKRMFRDGGAVKVSRSLKELGMKVARETELFVKAEGRDPTISELSKKLGFPPEQISEAISATMSPLSLTASNDDGEIQTDIPTPAPEGRITELMSLHTELARLPEADRRLISLRFFAHKTQSEVAGLLNMTQVQVSRREKKILLLLRQNLL